MYCSIVMHGQLLFKKAFIPPPIEVGVFCQNYDKKTGDGGSLHTARSSEVRAIFEQCDALARIGCDVVLFILFNISAIGVVPICCFRVSLPLLNHMRSMTMSLNRIGLSKPKASGSS